MINILVNKAQLSRSAKALGVASIDSSQVINRLRAYVDIVSTRLSCDSHVILPVLFLVTMRIVWISVNRWINHRLAVTIKHDLMDKC